MTQQRPSQFTLPGRETSEETDRRLRAVIAEADFVVYDGAYLYEEFLPGDFARRADPAALALVRDDEVWSQLVPAPAGQPGAGFTVFRFHFAGSLSPTGFIAWLATHVRETVGTGVLVVCGQNSGRTGIFDYWAVPREKGAATVAEVRRLRGE